MTAEQKDTSHYHQETSYDDLEFDMPTLEFLTGKSASGQLLWSRVPLYKALLPEIKERMCHGSWRLVLWGQVESDAPHKDSSEHSSLEQTDSARPESE
jgi:hypothetical protein